ncbi:hypothetical protein [Luteimonas sp. SDU82]|uniref:hypothetical protein n=1 Tax=Luteimonas sp. SDU82 TaxID=3422592 RepID=UPI003EC0F318
MSESHTLQGSVEYPNLSDEALFKLHTQVLREAKRRGLRFSVGELGEKVVIDLFRKRPDLPVLVAAPVGTRNVDALSRSGDRYSIKTLQRSKKSGTIYPDREDPDKQLFEFLVVVRLNEDLELARAILLSWQQFCEVRKWDVTMKAWYVAATQSVLNRGTQLYPPSEA